ncbi:MAG: hypothetical protein GX442_17405 [Candidatus Riflebacteria bacterium]|nr:hypothetical protein [Candidatus Riflebacteria bacterium]
MRRNRWFPLMAGVLALCLAAIPLGAQVGSRQGRQGPRGMAGGMASDPEMQAFQQQQKAKTDQFMAELDQRAKEFMPTLAGLPKADKLAAVRAYKTDYFQRNSAFRLEMHQAHRAFVAQRMAARGMPPQAQATMLGRIDASYAEFVAFHEKKHQENMAFLDGLEKDPALDGPALDKALADFFKSQKEDARKFLEEQKAGAQRGGQQGGRPGGGFGGQRGGR